MSGYADRFWAKVERRGPSECWPWTSCAHIHGYGQFFAHGRVLQAHRVAFELAGGVLPDYEADHRWTLDHRCHVPETCEGGPTCPHRLCCNPAHLKIVTQKENILRGNSPTAVNATKTHCKRGHAFTAGNTYTNPKGSRVCKACRRETDRMRSPRA